MEGLHIKAQRVVIWLGEQEDRSEVVTESLPWINQNLLGFGNYSEFSTSMSLSKNELPTEIHLVWQAIRDIMERPSFKRLWIVQETALTLQLFVMCGNPSISSGTYLQRSLMQSTMHERDT